MYGEIRCDDWKRGGRREDDSLTNMKTFKQIEPMRRDNVGETQSALRLARYHERSPDGRVGEAMRPPTNAEKAMQECVAELRKKRLEWGDIIEWMNDRLQCDEKTFNTTDMEKACIEMRRRRGGNHRLSVPNLMNEAAWSPEKQTARALRERMGRNGDGELGVSGSNDTHIHAYADNQ